MGSRRELVKLLIERFRHKPACLTVPQTVMVIRKLLRHALPGDGGCCLWAGAVNNDHYGKLNLWMYGRTHQLYVHRLAELLANNPSDPPHWMEIAHSCDVPPCFHPDHVERQRRRDNREKSMRNTLAKRRVRRERLEEHRTP